MTNVGKQKIILIIGMHRSGTSALTRLINLMGFELNEQTLMPPVKDNNETGFWEHAKIANLNEKILNHFNQSWFSINKIPEIWKEDQQLQQFRDEARQILENDFSQFSHWALKDPRLCKVLPFWASLLKEMHCDVYAVCSLRNPIEVALSLKKRDKLSELRGYLLWMEYNLAAEKNTREFPRVYVNYEDILHNPIATLQYIENKLGISFPNKPETQAAKVQEFLKEELRHHCAGHQDIEKISNYFPYLAETYYLLKNPSSLAAHNLQVLDEISNKLEIFRVLCQDENNLQEQLRQQQCEMGHLHACINQIETDKRQIQLAWEETQAMLHQVESQLEQTKTYLETLQNSISWKVTAPLRKIRQLC